MIPEPEREIYYLEDGESGEPGPTLPPPAHYIGEVQGGDMISRHALSAYAENIEDGPKSCASPGRRI